MYKGITKPKIGITKGNIGKIWYECEDGKIRGLT